MFSLIIYTWYYIPVRNDVQIYVTFYSNTISVVLAFIFKSGYMQLGNIKSLYWHSLRIKVLASLHWSGYHLNKNSFFFWENRKTIEYILPEHIQTGDITAVHRRWCLSC